MSNNYPLIDVTALFQGVVNAFEDGRITRDFYDVVCYVINDAKCKSSSGRAVIPMSDFLEAMSKVEYRGWSAWANLWKYLGESIGSGLVVASHCELVLEAAESE